MLDVSDERRPQGERLEQYHECAEPAEFRLHAEESARRPAAETLAAGGREGVCNLVAILRAVKCVVTFVLCPITAKQIETVWDGDATRSKRFLMLLLFNRFDSC
jgi:hypothetical protein